jgi:hypothetical protein
MTHKRIPVYDISDFKYIGTQTDFYANTFAEHMELSGADTRPIGQFGLFGALLFGGNLCSLFTRFRKPDSNRLLAAGHLLAASSALELAMLHFIHDLFHLFL